MTGTARGDVRRILVGTDGSEAATNAVDWAAHLAGALDAELVVATALVPGVAGCAGDDAARHRDRVVRHLEDEWSERARAVRPGLRMVVLDGDPRAALLDATANEAADLLVLGSTGIGWFPALHLGHVAHAIAHHAEVPLVVVRHDAPPRVSGPVLVGIDGSPGSTAAAQWAAGLAQLLGVEVVVVHSHLGGRSPETPDGLEHRVADWTAALRDAGVPVRALVGEGWPAKVITELASVEQPVVVVTGTRGTSGFRDVRLGSVALQLLQRAEVPVAIVPVPG